MIITTTKTYFEVQSKPRRLKQCKRIARTGGSSKPLAYTVASSSHPKRHTAGPQTATLVSGQSSATDLTNSSRSRAEKHGATSVEAKLGADSQWRTLIKLLSGETRPHLHLENQSRWYSLNSVRKTLYSVVTHLCP